MAERKCKGCGRTIYSGMVCSRCKPMEASPVITAETTKVEGNAKTDPEGGAIATVSELEKQPNVEGKKMASGKRGTCSNCCRPDLLIFNAAGHCYSCHYVSRGLEGEERQKALDAVKQRLQDPNNKRVSSGRTSRIPTIKQGEGTPRAKVKTVATSPISKSEVDLEQISAPVSPPQAAIPTQPDTTIKEIYITIITEEDKAAYLFIEEQARMNRRSIPQQLLWMIECNQVSYNELKEKNTCLR